jgi:hypothetical protein
MAYYQIDKFNAGLADYEDKGVAGSYKYSKNLDIRKRIDSLTCGQRLTDEGLASSHSPSLSVSPSASPSKSPSLSVSPSVSVSPSPSASTGVSASPSATQSVSISLSPSVTPSSSVSLSPSPTAGLTTVFEDLVRWFVKAKDGYTYGFGNTGCVYRRDADAYWRRVYKDPDGEIKGAAEWYTSTKNYLYFATSTKLKRKDEDGLANWNDVTNVSQELENVSWHTMTEAGGGLTIANGSFLAFVGYDDSFTPEALDLIPGNLAKTIVERNGRAIVGTVRQSDQTIGVNGAIDTEVPIAQCGSNGEFFFTGSSSSPAKVLPGGGKCNPGGVCNVVEPYRFFEWEYGASSWNDKAAVGGLALFGIYSATSGHNGVYSFGRKSRNAPFAMNLEYELDVNEIGAVCNVNGTTLVSYRSSSSYGVKAVDSSYKATAEYHSLDLKSPPNKEAVVGKITVWDRIEVFCKPLPNSVSINCYFKINKNGDWQEAKMENGVATLNSQGETKGVFLVGATADIFEFKLVLNPAGNNTPEIYRIRTYFS